MKKNYWIAFFFICSFIFSSLTYAQNNLLYFCEKYEDSLEIGVSDKFTLGWLTVIVDLRETGDTIGVSDVELVILKIADSAGTAVNDTIDIIPFDVEPDWDYIYFADEDRLSFDEPGTYEVICRKADGTEVASGEVEIVNEEN